MLSQYLKIDVLLVKTFANCDLQTEQTKLSKYWLSGFYSMAGFYGVCLPLVEKLKVLDSY